VCFFSLSLPISFSLLKVSIFRISLTVGGLLEQFNTASEVIFSCFKLLVYEEGGDSFYQEIVS